MNILILPDLINYKIYKFLSQKDKAALSLTCKYFNKMPIRMYGKAIFFKKVHKFIEENYTIKHSSLEKIKRFFYCEKSILALGEIHLNDEHRLLNSSLVNLCWRINSALFVEGDLNSLEHFKLLGKGQLKYILPDIAKKAATWDILHNSFINETNINFFSFTKSTVLIIQALQNLSFVEEAFSSRDYIDFIKINCPEEIFQFLKATTDRSTFTQTILNKIYYLTVTAIYKTLRASNRMHLSDYNKATSMRNHSLIRAMYTSICKKNRGIIVAGQSHLNEKNARTIRKLAQTLITNDCREQTPILFLIPKQSISHESIKSSYLKYFDNSFFPPIDTHINSLQINTELEHIKEQIRTCDVETIDMDQNHFGYWLHICFSYLKQEMQRFEE